MSTARIRLPKLHSSQLKIKRERKRFNVIDCGRRFGKNILFQDLAVECVVGDAAPCAWAAPTYKMLMDDWRNLTNVLSPLITGQSEQEKQIRLATGGILDMWSMDNADSIRGRKYKRFIINEAAFVPGLVEEFSMVIRPTLIDLSGDAYIGGTPKGRNGFWQLYNINDPDWMRWQMSSYCNPHIPSFELDALKSTITERAFKQEIMAEFLEDGGGVFRYVTDAATLDQTDPKEGKQYCSGVDWARTEDATVFAVMEMGTKDCVYLDRMTNTDFSTQRMRLKSLSERYNKASVLAEQNSIGLPQIEELQKAGVPVTGFLTTNISKAEIIQALELAFEQRSIKIVKDDNLINELLAFESERLPSGMVRYSAPEGMHDDTVIALALALHGCGGWWFA